MYQFKVKWYDNGIQETCGLVNGRTLCAAMGNLSEYFGECNIEYCSLEPVGDIDNVLCYKEGVTSLIENFDV